MYKENYVCDPGTYSSEIKMYSKSITDDLVLTYKEILDVTDAVSINLNDEKETWPLDNHYTLLTLLISNYIVNNNYYHVLLLRKISTKEKRHIIILKIQKWRLMMNWKKLIFKISHAIILIS